MSRIFLVSWLFLSAFVFFPSSVFAQANSCAGVQNGCDEGEAFAVCKAALEHTIEYRTSQGGAPVTRSACTHPTGQEPNGFFSCDVRSSSGGYGCFLAGTTTPQSEFYHTKLCTSRPPILGQVREWSERCVGGCLLEVKDGAGVSFSWGGETFTRFHGDLRYTKVCPYATPNTPDGPGPDNPEECEPIQGFSMCLKKNGDQCLTASSGKQFCWTPGQPTNETSGNENVATDPTAPPAPNAPPADGTGWNPPLAPAPTTSTAPTSGGAGVVVVINVSTSTGSTGSPPAGPPTTPPTDPPTDPPPPTPPDEGCDPATDPNCEESAAGGGETCDAPPTCSGDPINCQVLNQVWRTRCTTEGKIGADGGCDAPQPACVGSKVLCETAERERRRWCELAQQQRDYYNGVMSEAGQSDNLDGVSESDIFGEPNDSLGQVDPNLLGGGAGGQCAAAFTIGGQSVAFPPEFWDVAAVIRWLVIAMAYIWAAAMVFK